MLTEIYTAAKPDSVACWDGKVFLQEKSRKIRSVEIKIDVFEPFFFYLYFPRNLGDKYKVGYNW